VATATTGGDAAPAASAQAASEAVAPPKVATELNGLAIFWALVKSWFSGLFGKKTA